MPDAQHIEFIARGIIVRENAILACRNVAKGYHYLPGGHIEFGETPAQAVARELHEEAGLHTTVRECLLVCETRFTQSNKQRQEVNIVFHVEPTAANPLSAAKGVPSLEPDIAFDWLDLAQLVEVDLRPQVIKAWLLSSDRLPSGKGIDWISHPPAAATGP